MVERSQGRQTPDHLRSHPAGFTPAQSPPTPDDGGARQRTLLHPAVAKEITGNRCLPARRSVGGARTGSEDEVWVVFGAELDCGKLWRSRSLGAGVDQPEDPWEVRERLLAEEKKKEVLFGSERAALRTKFGSFLARN